MDSVGRRELELQKKQNKKQTGSKCGRLALKDSEEEQELQVADSAREISTAAAIAVT